MAADGDAVVAAELGKDPQVIRQVREVWADPEMQSAVAEARRRFDAGDEQPTP